MKRSLSLFFVLIIVLTACTFEANKEYLKLPLKMTAKLSGGETVFTADISETDGKITFQSPSDLSNLILEFKDNEGTAKVGDFERSVDFNMFPAQKALIEAVRFISSSPESKVLTENGAKYTIDETVIMVYYNGDKSKIVRIETEESGRRFSFDVVGLELYEAQSESAG